jgi:NADH dehydrogenase [ubiquinone] 1 alpha subcomplex assembly factor 6
MATFPDQGGDGYAPERSRATTPDRHQRSAGARRLSPVATLVRRHDRDRFQTALFAPAAHREALFAIYAFNYEIARVREVVREPILGRIRLEWWREAVAEAYEGGAVRRHIVVEALAGAIRERTLERRHFERLIAAREADLEAVAPESFADLERYAEESSAPLVELALASLGGQAPAVARHVGIAYALAGLLRVLPVAGPRRRPVVPQGQTSSAAAVEIAGMARRHLAAARALRPRPPRQAVPALLPAIVAERSLDRLRRAGFDPYDRRLLVPDPLQSWRLAFAALRGRF